MTRMIERMKYFYVNNLPHWKYCGKEGYFRRIKIKNKSNKLNEND